MHFNLVEIILQSCRSLPVTISAECLQGLMLNYQEWMSLSWRVKFASTLHFNNSSFQLSKLYIRLDDKSILYHTLLSFVLGYIGAIGI